MFRPLSYLTLRNARLVVLPLFWIPAASIFINDNVVEVTSVTGSSMEPTLSPDDNTTGRKDSILWDKWNATTNVQRGDVVFFSLPHSPERTGVKRVIAVEGDIVLLDPRRRPKHEGRGEDTPDSRSWDMWRGRVRVPEGHMWVEGDNWRKSRDSNWYGPVSKSLILGKALMVVQPYERFGAKPWEGFRSRTKIRERERDWKTDWEMIQAIEGDSVI